MRSTIRFTLLAAFLVLTNCEPEASPLVGTWEGRRFDTDIWTMTIEDAHGRLTGTYEIQWEEDPPRVSGPLTGSSISFNPDFIDVLIEFNVELAAGTAECRCTAQHRDEVVMSGETVCVRDAIEFQIGHLGMRRR